MVSRTLKRNLALQKTGKNFDDVQSYASYTEIKLNQLYEKSNSIQESAR